MIDFHEKNLIWLKLKSHKITVMCWKAVWIFWKNLKGPSPLSKTDTTYLQSFLKYMLYISLNQKPFNLNGKDFSFKREFFLQKYYCSVRPPSSPALRSIFCSNLGQWQNLFIWLCPFIKPILDIYITPFNMISWPGAALTPKK